MTVSGVPLAQLEVTMRTLIVILALLVAPKGLTAQRAHPFAEVSIGPTRGVGGDSYHTRGSVAMMVAVGTQPHSNRSFMVAAHAGLWGAHGDDQCPAEVPNGCLPQFPIGRVIALSAGGRTLGAARIPIELLAGPAFVSPVESGRTSTGIFAQLRIGTAPGAGLSPALLLQGLVVRMEGSTLGAGAAGLGLRVW
jgi:hypothetical protein